MVNCDNNFAKEQHLYSKVGVIQRIEGLRVGDLLCPLPAVGLSVIWGARLFK